jgi:type VI secretion system secreted protein Hcp
MPLDYFLVMEGVPGDVAVPGQKGVGGMPVLSYSWGVDQTGGVATGGGGGAGKAQFGDLIVTKPVGRCSPMLFLGCASGKHYPSAVLLVLDSSAKGKGPREMERYTLQDVVISSIRNSGAQGASRDTSELHLQYRIIGFRVAQYDAAGNMVGATEHGWDRALNKGV